MAAGQAGENGKEEDLGIRHTTYPQPWTIMLEIRRERRFKGVGTGIMTVCKSRVSAAAVSLRCVVISGYGSPLILLCHVWHSSVSSQYRANEHGMETRVENGGDDLLFAPRKTLDLLTSMPC